MTLVFGLILIIMGAVFIFLPQFGLNFWLLFVWLPGVLMEERGLRKNIPGLLVPAGVILVVASILTIETLFPGFTEAGGWALYNFAPAFGLLQLYLAQEKKDRGLLYPIGILSTLTIIFLVSSFANVGAGTLFGIALIAFGVFMLIKRK
ncbi:hypothetical protein AT15_10355 [Kosmotoga arenicorallina S304]|uniref:DUF5668 domain-containing protein n=1 Tax=Kosmotoga arenicorallina S304 TaxID=1453497 RepID=A0A176K1E4_9BACT|nr:hypothetical protein [Kosmotoga arenicorallina]MDK2954499.1 hypothetical protein [Kosmotoga sp.]OAA30431.1 hypothetical protein AT15_10355 [Kosmotoga arenicorallina S304]